MYRIKKYTINAHKVSPEYSAIKWGSINEYFLEANPRNIVKMMRMRYNVRFRGFVKLLVVYYELNIVY